MWAPSRVVNKHKKRASFVWVLILGLIAGYTMWLFCSTYKKRRTPEATLELQEERYSFPTVTLCFVERYGCNSQGASCAPTVRVWASDANGFDIGEDDIEESNKAYEDECVDIRLSDIPKTDDLSELLPPEITLEVYWQLSSGDVADEVSEYSESIPVFFTAPDILDPLADHNQSIFVGVIPYSRQEAGEELVVFKTTDISMEMIENVKLNGEKTKNYFAASITPSDYVVSGGAFNGSTFDVAFGRMSISLAQPQLSYTLRKEIDPFEWNEITGNIGGMWGILLVMWGVLFVATREEPNLKGRNFRKTAKQGVDGVVKGAQSVASMVGVKRFRTPAAVESEEDTPAWDTADEASSRLRRGRTLPLALNPTTNGSTLEGMAAASNAGQPQETFFGFKRFTEALPNQHGNDAGNDTGSDAPSVLESRVSTSDVVAIDVPRPVSRLSV